jgi:hypothetical protein
MIIYKTTNKLNGKIYIGQDKNNNPYYFGSGKKLQSAIHKYGKENFTKEVLEECTDENHMNEREIYWISFYNSKDRKLGYNISEGGKEGDRKIGQDIAKGGIYNYWLGKYGKEEADKRKQSQIEKIIKHNKDNGTDLTTKGRYGIWLEKYGKEEADRRHLEWRLKISQYQQYKMENGWKHTDESKEKISSASKGRKLSEEVKNIFNIILKYRVDPAADYYTSDIDSLVDEIKKLDNKALFSTDSEYRYERKGMDYDPILENFILGSGGQISTWDKIENQKTPVLLRGITKRKQMKACKEQGRDFYYIDTGYFGNGRKKSYHRVTKNSMQNISDVIDRPKDRFQATGVSLTKFRGGSKILLCPPSAKVMVYYDLDLNKWMEETVETIKKYTDREIVVRLKKPRAERVNNDTMAMALSQDIHCMVTFNSIAATESLLLGKPAFTLAPNAAQSLCLSDLSQIEKPYIPTLDEVHKWACHLAYCQFTEAEMRSGLAWRIVSEK